MQEIPANHSGVFGDHTGAGVASGCADGEGGWTVLLLSWQQTQFSGQKL